MKKIMILAGGTATAWHLVNEIEKYYNGMLEVYICDINPPYLIPSSTKSKNLYKYHLYLVMHIMNILCLYWKKIK
ncbi:hypothetical protein Q5M85_12630 [Paraclostridium bifermentans]|nr:hypothetical protein [Paraclostridium bifermentans]